MQMEEEFKQGEEDESIDFSQVTEEGVFERFTDDIIERKTQQPKIVATALTSEESIQPTTAAATSVIEIKRGD